MQKVKFIFLFLSIISASFAQRQVIDKVIGIVGKYPILLSDLQNSMLEREKQEEGFNKCKAFETLVFQKLLVAQADRDSVTVSDAEVDHELNQRMTYYIQQFGSEQKLEEFYGKRTNVIKDELRGDIQEQLIAQKMQGKITGDVKLTPAEVRLFYSSIPQDSLPLINSEVELQQIVKRPTFSAEAKQIAKDQLESYRQDVLGKPKEQQEMEMKKKAVLYSEDPGSANKGGFYGNVGRGVMDPAFESAAFRLKQGEVSNVFETAYGYHFIQLIQRKGELLDLRHILIVPKMSNGDFYLSKQQLDSIYADIKEGKITFEEAAKKYSDDNDTKQNGGLMINRGTASTKFDNDDLSQIDQNLVATLNSMQIGDISKPMQFMSPTDGKPAFRLLKLKNRIDPHRTNLKDDYQKLALMAGSDYNKKLVKEWIQKRSKITYIKLDPEYACPFENKWTISN
ncbi:MAG: peptidylprolyl isomerase [Bacteroidetes bacterium]|nr:peptidylprolyl isomerase [Bacteroidota bacterium]